MVHMHALGKSFRYAWKGLVLVFRSEQNFRIQLVAGFVVIAAALALGLPTWKVIILILISLSILVLELVNSIFERLADALKPRIHHYVAEMKDIMAGAVLLGAVGATVVGVLLFWPHLALWTRQVIQFLRADS